MYNACSSWCTRYAITYDCAKAVLLDRFSWIESVRSLEELQCLYRICVGVCAGEGGQCEEIVVNYGLYCMHKRLKQSGFCETVPNVHPKALDLLQVVLTAVMLLVGRRECYYL